MNGITSSASGSGLGLLSAPIASLPHFHLARARAAPVGGQTPETGELMDWSGPTMGGFIAGKWRPSMTQLRKFLSFPSVLIIAAMWTKAARFRNFCHGTAAPGVVDLDQTPGCHSWRWAVQGVRPSNRRVNAAAMEVVDLDLQHSL